MKHFRALVLTTASIVMLSLAGCANIKNYAKTVHSWHGANVYELTSKWGYPDSIQKLPNGNEVYVYNAENRGGYSVYTTPQHTSVATRHGEHYVRRTSPTTVAGGGAFDLHCTTWFEFNRDHRIVSSSFRGNDCAATKSFIDDASRYGRMPEHATSGRVAKYHVRHIAGTADLRPRKTRTKRAVVKTRRVKARKVQSRVIRKKTTRVNRRGAQQSNNKRNNAEEIKRLEKKLEMLKKSKI